MRMGGDRGRTAESTAIDRREHSRRWLLRTVGTCAVGSGALAASSGVGSAQTGPIGGWDPNERYRPNDQVYWDGAIWEAQRSSAGVEPGDDADAWRQQEPLAVSLSVSNVRRAQVVDRTTLGDEATAAHREPYVPDLVVGTPATVLFDLSYDLEPVVDPAAVDFRDLLSGTRVVVRTDQWTRSGVIEHEAAFDLGDLPADLLDSSSGSVALFDHRDGVHRALAAVDDPCTYVVQPPYRRAPRVAVVPGRDAVSGDDAREATAPRRRRPLALRLGFVGISDPDRGANYGPALEADADAVASNPPTLEATVRDAAAYVEATFPTTDVRAYVHEEPVEGSPSPDVVSETWWANASLQVALAERDGSIPQSDLIRGNGPIEAFDLTVLVGPQDYGSGDYLSFNGLSGVGASPPDENRAVVVLESDAETSVVENYHAPSTIAHEIAHRFTRRPYCELPAVADRAGEDSLAYAAGAVDCEHADEAVHSVALEIDPAENALEVRTERSFMAAGPGRQWIDQRLYQHLLESAFVDLGADSSSNDVSDVGHRTCPHC